MSIEVIPHLGRNARGEEVVLDQFQVMVNGRRVGYCGKRAGATISFIAPVDDATKEQVKEAVQKAIKGDVGKVHIPKPLTQAAKKYIEKMNQK